MSTNLLSPSAEQRPPFFRTVSSTSQYSTKSTKSSKSLSIPKTFSREKDKPRLYLALFPRGGSTGAGGGYGSQLSCDSHHWALLIGSKSPLRSEAGTAYHVVHSSEASGNKSPLLYEETDLVENRHQSRALLVRITLAKVLDEQRVIALLRSNAAITNKNSQGDPRGRQESTGSIETSSLSCLSWVKSAWELLSSDSHKPLKSYFGPDDWEDIDARARKYVKRKKQQGRFQTVAEGQIVSWKVAEVPTWNFWENRETTD
ncbi:hypothetical protein H2198_009748 [Neophaeococcomyces mojaviensis]|uniref:Uncharacterized protein n=1 Tax=Neophaeococcomyces mojaviensis TaxID=3383035 RepID=A0ACC2ZTV4_9EURO|nr:hypothetical protein H2198_009748 [Knufia sp. JES_112]